MKRSSLLLILVTAPLSMVWGSFIIDEIVTNTQTLSNAGGTGWITPDGSITVGADPGVLMQNNNQRLINEGLISASGPVTARGVQNVGGDNSIIDNRGTILISGPNIIAIQNQNSQGVMIINSGTIQGAALGEARGIQNQNSLGTTITNSGLIETGGDFGYGIINSGSNNTTITNSGLIETGGDFGHGIFNSGSNNATITNSGLIETSGVEARGIYNLVSQGSTITNSGTQTIITTNDGAHGIHNEISNDVTIENSGTIQTSGEGSHAIFNDGSNNVSIFNTGHLITQGLNSDAIRSSGDNVHITNGGTIESQQGFALNLSGDNPTLTSLHCSKIIGPVFSEELLNFNVPVPFNMILTLTDESAGFGELSINGPFVQMGNTIAILDSRAFTLSVDIVADLSDTLLNSLSNACYDCCTPDGTSLWLQGIGSIRERGSGFERLSYRQGGFLAGFTTSCFGGAPLSLFGGAVFGTSNAMRDACGLDLDLNTTSYVAGFSYERPFCNGCIMLSAYAGSLKIDQKRAVFDNLAPNGVFESRGKSSGFFVTPEASFRQRFALQNRPVAMTAALRYAGFFPGDYKESFFNQDVKIERRGTSLLTARLLLGLPFSCPIDANCLNIEPYFGAAGRFQLSSCAFKGAFMGQQCSFLSGLSRNIPSFLYGLKACYTVCNLDFNASFEGDFENEKSQRYIGSAGIAYRF